MGDTRTRARRADRLRRRRAAHPSRRADRTAIEGRSRRCPRHPAGRARSSRRPRCSSGSASSSKSSAARTMRSSAPTSATALLDSGAVAERDADRHGSEPSLSLAADHARLGDRASHPRVGRRHRRPRRESSRGALGGGVRRSTHARGRPRCRRRRVVLGFALAVDLPPAPRRGCSRCFGTRSALPSVLLLFLLLVVAVSAVGGLWPALTAAISRLPTRQLVLHPAALHVHDQRRGEHPRAGCVPRRCGRRQRLRRARGPPGGRGSPCARRGRGALSARRLLSGLGRPREPSAACSSLDGAAVLHRSGSGWQIEAASGDRAPESPEASSLTIELDGEHVLALAGPPIRSEDQRMLDAFAKELTSSVELGELEAEAESRGRARPRPTSSARRSSPRSPTTCARRSRRSRPPSRACFRTTSNGRRRHSASSSRRSTRRPTGSTHSSETCST